MNGYNTAKKFAPKGVKITICDLTGQECGGAYDPKAKEILVSDKYARSTKPRARFVSLHEVGHAIDGVTTVWIKTNHYSFLTNAVFSLLSLIASVLAFDLYFYLVSAAIISGIIQIYAKVQIFKSEHRASEIAIKLASEKDKKKFRQYAQENNAAYVQILSGQLEPFFMILAGQVVLFLIIYLKAK